MSDLTGAALLAADNATNFSKRHLDYIPGHFALELSCVVFLLGCVFARLLAKLARQVVRRNAQEGQDSALLEADTVPDGDASAAPLSPETPSTREARELMRSRLMQELFQGTVFLMVMTIAGFVVLLILGLTAFYAAMTSGGEPCDQPLRYYLAMFLFCTLVQKRLDGRINTRDHRRALLLRWAVVLWGFYMVNACKTCPDTNPELYYPTKYYVYALGIFCVLTTAASLVGQRAVVMLLLALERNQSGCSQAVASMPAVLVGSDELCDADDGSIMDCPICAEQFVGELEIVSTPCRHLFHRECLSQWCTNHLDCPLCRAQLGPPDDEAGAQMV